MTCLSAHSGDHDVGHTERSRQQRGRGPPVCWGCRESDHLRRKCPHCRTGQEQPRVSDGRHAKGTFSLATDTALSTCGWIHKIWMLVETGSAVTIVQEDAWKEAVIALRRPLNSVTYPVVVVRTAEPLWRE